MNQQESARGAERDTPRWALALFAATLVTTAVVRAIVIAHYPEPDGDAKGHLGIATALLSDPFRVAVHWVWPPGYHYLLALLLWCGFGAQGVRFLNCALAALLPVVVWRYAARTLPETGTPPPRLSPVLAGTLCAAMPVVNLLGTSAQQGTVFALLVLGAVWAIDSGRFKVAGVTLACAVMVRYEAAGAIAVLAGLWLLGCIPALSRRLPGPVARACSLPAVVFVPGVAAMAGWLLAHRVADGQWLGFLHELVRYTRVQRQTFFHQDAWHDFLFFPVVQPYYLFGLTLPLFLIGAAKSWRVSFVVPLGIYLFLLGSYTLKGVLASGRYYESLTPFLCIGATRGAFVVGERWRPATPLAYGAALAHVVRLLLLTGQWTFHFAPR